ncbi:MAG: glycosyltransferase [Candidatus Nezhaarchaeota archaeon]|nr:glycosyltransferase [Candidatus Nezhaarchaeota archaeon]
MLLTIALLTKDSADTVWYALKSILRQSVPPSTTLELVVIDGYSTDDTLEIVRDMVSRLYVKFDRQLIRHVIRQERVGVGYARNLALKEAFGDWILWVDSDNMLAQDYILKAVREIERRRNAKVLYPHKVVTVRRSDSLAERLITCYSCIISQALPPEGLRGIARRLIRDEPAQRLLPYTAMQGAVCETKFLCDLGGFNPYLLAAEDIDIYLRVLSRGGSMQPFDSTLYCFARRTLSAWLKQAIVWGYGKEVLMQAYRSSSPVQNLKTRWISSGIDNPIRNLIVHTLLMTFSLLTKSVSVCGVLGLFMPLVYIYRRAGYVKGYLCALKQRRKYA